MNTRNVSVRLTHARWFKAARRPLTGSLEPLALALAAAVSLLLCSPVVPLCPVLCLLSVLFLSAVHILFPL